MALRQHFNKVFDAPVSVLVLLQNFTQRIHLREYCHMELTSL